MHHVEAVARPWCPRGNCRGRAKQCRQVLAPQRCHEHAHCEDVVHAWLHQANQPVPYRWTTGATGPAGLWAQQQRDSNEHGRGIAQVPADPAEHVRAD